MSNEKKITKAAKQSFIRTKLGTSQKWATHALLLIFSLQTADEQATNSTSNLNNIGFTGSDAYILSSFAKQFEKKGWLSPKQMAIVMKKMPKYCRQVMNNSNQEKLENMVRVAA